MLANTLPRVMRWDWGPRVLTGFVDDEVNQCLGLDAEREAALELVALGPEGEAGAASGPWPAIAHDVMPLSSDEVDYPSLREIHRASGLATAEAVVGLAEGGRAARTRAPRVARAAPRARVWEPRAG
jgi:hypothetical protein